MKAAAAAAFLAATLSSATTKEATEIRIAPGPTVMSEQEKLIVADPAGGTQHGVTLVTETERNENLGTSSETRHHTRAKILSLEGRGLADISIPVERGNSSLKTWWGRTILPDGTVLELRQEDLESQSVMKSAAGDYGEIKAALPGIVPGCIVDYGYVLRQDGFIRSSRVFIQQSWPVRSFRYRWVPSKFMAAAYVMSRAEGLEIHAKADASSVLVTGRDLSTVADEPQMPPIGEARASVTFYYTTGEKPSEYWELGSKRAESTMRRFLGSAAALRDAVAAIGVPTGAPLPEKLEAAYNWLGANIKNTHLMSAEEEEADGDRDDDAYNAKTVLKAGAGSARQIDYLFAGMARALGAEADLVFAVDRTDRFWRPALKTFGQFTYTFVGVRAPGEGDDAIVIVDPGSGLPYGQVPWRATGGNGLLCSGKGRPLPIPPAAPIFNRADTRVELSYSEDNEIMIAKWSRTAKGATGLEERRWLRDLDARERADTLDRICGASGHTEVLTAELPGLDSAAAPFEIGCELEMADVNVGEDISRYSLRPAGPWWPRTPEFSAATRAHPVIFDYPKVDFLAIDVTAPRGFKPGDPPAPVRLESPYGRYHLTVTKTPTGYHLDRAFALTVLIAKTEEYEALRQYFAEVNRVDQTTLSFERDGSTE